MILFGAYSNAALSMTDPKKFPKTFDNWLKRPKQADMKPQSDAEIWAAFKAWGKAHTK